MGRHGRLTSVVEDQDGVLFWFPREVCDLAVPCEAAGVETHYENDFEPALAMELEIEGMGFERVVVLVAYYCDGAEAFARAGFGVEDCWEFAVHSRLADAWLANATVRGCWRFGAGLVAQKG